MLKLCDKLRIRSFDKPDFPWGASLPFISLEWLLLLWLQTARKPDRVEFSHYQSCLNEATVSDSNYYKL